MNYPKRTIIIVITGILLISGTLLAQWFARQDMQKRIADTIRQEQAEEQRIREEMVLIRTERAKLTGDISPEQINTAHLALASKIAATVNLQGVTVQAPLMYPAQNSLEACTSLPNTLSQQTCQDNIRYQNALEENNPRTCSLIQSLELQEACELQFTLQTAMETQDISTCFPLSSYNRSLCYSLLEPLNFFTASNNHCEQYPSTDQADCVVRLTRYQEQKTANAEQIAQDIAAAQQAITDKNPSACPEPRVEDYGIHSWCRLEILTPEIRSQAGKQEALCALMNTQSQVILTNPETMTTTYSSEQQQCTKRTAENI